MKNKSALILIVTTILTVGYSIYDFQSEKKSEKAHAEQNRLVKFDKDQISEFEISKTGGTGFVVERSPEGWKIKSPIQETADQAACQDYIDGVVLEQSKDSVKKGAGIDWKIYGLDQPAGTLSFKINSGQSLKIEVSAKKNFAGDSYLRIQGEEQVFLAAATWLSKTEKRLFAFRDKRILKKSAAQIGFFKYDHGKENFRIEKKDSQWTAPVKPSWKLDQTRSNEFVYMLNTVNAIDFSKEGVASPNELKEFGLNKPEFTIEVGLKDQTPSKVVFASNQKKESFVQTFDPHRILKIASQDMDKFLKMSLEAFRDRHEPFDFDKTHVKKMHILNGDLTADFILKNDDWVVDNQDKTLDYQVDRPKAILALVRNLEIMDFEPEHGIEKGQGLNQNVQFIDEQGKIVYEIKFFSTYKKTIEGLPKIYVQAKSSTYPSMVGVDEGSFRSIGLESIVKKKEEKVSEKSSEKPSNKPSEKTPEKPVKNEK